MELTEKELSEIENDILRLCKNVAIPRFMRSLRIAAQADQLASPAKGVALSSADFKQMFVDWISYGNLDANFEVKPLTTYRDEILTKVLDEDIPF